MTKLGRTRVIPDRTSGADYMERTYLFLKDRKWFPFNVTMHNIKKSDIPVFHDHPWPYVTVVWKGGYWEHRPVFNSHGEKVAEITEWCGPGTILWRKSTDYHWLELDNDQPATTLFFMGPQKRDWGFLVPDFITKKLTWISHTDYLADK